MSYQAFQFVRTLLCFYLSLGATPILGSLLGEISMIRDVAPKPSDLTVEQRCLIQQSSHGSVTSWNVNPGQEIVGLGYPQHHCEQYCTGILRSV